MEFRKINCDFCDKKEQLKNQQIAKSQEIQNRIIAHGTKLIEPMNMIFSDQRRILI